MTNEYFNIEESNFSWAVLGGEQRLIDVIAQCQVAPVWRSLAKAGGRRKISLKSSLNAFFCLE